MKQRCIVT